MHKAQAFQIGTGSESLVRAVLLWNEMKAPHAESAGFQIPIVTLNIGGRNTNPLEFILEGDMSEMGQQVVDMGLRARDAMVDGASGPAAMPHAERALVNKILRSIYGECR